MYILEKEHALKLSAALASSYYKERVNYLEKVLRATRSKRHKNNKEMLLAMQFNIAKFETNIWNTLSEGRNLAKQLNSKSSLTSEEEKDLKGIEEHILIHEHLIRISRTICDGIAWRNLNYNRTFLNSSARGFGAGRIDVNSKEFKSEFMWAHRISKRLNSLVILNDLTRFLRIGDLTEINDGIAFIHEIKKYGKEVKNLFTLKKVTGNAKISKQAIRLLELQRIAFANKAKIYGIDVETKEVELDLKTNTNKVKKLFRESEKKFVVSDDIDECINVEVTNFHAIQEHKQKVDIEELKKISPKKRVTDLILVHSNWDTFYSDEKGNFVRSAPPYSIFPFSAKDCTFLMSGYYLVKCSLNVTKLKEVLLQNNWIIEERTEKDLDKQIADYEKEKDTMFTVKEGLYAHVPSDGGLFTVKRGPFSVSFDAMLYCRLTMEYLSVESILNILEHMYKIASQRRKDDIYFPRFRNENEFWN